MVCFMYILPIQARPRAGFFYWRKLVKLMAFLLGAGLALPVFAAPSVKVENAWVREPAPGQMVVGGFMHLTSTSNAALLQASSPAAGLVELHEMKMENGVMLMRPLQKIDLPRGQTVKLEPGGLHLMLEELKHPLKAGDKVPLTLKIQRGGKMETLKVSAEVRGMTPAAQPSHMKH